MNKAFEKIIEKLDEYKHENLVEHYYNEQLPHCKNIGDCAMQDCVLCVFDKAIEIVKQEAEKFGTDTNVGSNGWIPCSERLPEESLNSVIGWDEYRERCCFVQYIGGRWILGNDIDSVKIIAWQPLPEPYQPKGEING